MAVLREIAAGGYPTDYLVARLRGRRAAQAAATDRTPMAQGGERGSDESIWGALLTEFDWLRGQMNLRLRADFEPFFTLFAIKTLVLALRNVAAERQAAVERLVAHPLLAGGLSAALVRAPDVATAVTTVVAALGATERESEAIASAYARGGLKGLESALMRDVLERLAAARLQPAIGAFLATFIDLRNVMTLYKHLRWGLHDAAAFVTGGDLAVSRLSEASERGDGGYLDECVRELTGAQGTEPAASETALESRLLGSLTRRLRRAAREGGAEDVILDYAWSVYVLARNRALRLHAAQIDAATLERELVA